MFANNLCVVLVFFIIISTYFKFNNAFIGTWNRLNVKKFTNLENLS